jgi:hypothetical protein
VGTSYSKSVKTLNAHFDGRYVVLDEPAQLKPDTKVKVITADVDETVDAVARDFARLSEPVFQKIWDNPLDADYDKL